MSFFLPGCNIRIRNTAVIVFALLDIGCVDDTLLSNLTAGMVGKKFNTTGFLSSKIPSRQKMHARNDQRWL